MTAELPSPHDACAALARALVDSGVREACVFPGSRSTPLALALAQQPGLQVRVHVDERAGSFFALGAAKASRVPVALLCTSGTAAAELLAAVVEAHHARVPLIVLTADRPAELRDAGAGQTIDQIKLYGSHVRWFHELDGPPEPRRFAWAAARAVSAATGSPPGPVHLNVPLREPLVPSRPTRTYEETGPRVHAAAAPAPDSATVARLADQLGTVERGLVVCGPHDGEAALGRAVADLARALGWPLLADGASQLRAAPEVQALGCYDALLRNPAFFASHVPEAVVRLGASPTSKALGDLIVQAGTRRHVLLDPHGAWNDPAHRASDVVRADEQLTCTALAGAIAPHAETAWLRGWRDAEAGARAAIERTLSDTAELFEGKVFAELADLLPDGSILYVGNSMPIRDLDSFLPASRRRLRILSNRGANGIDGFLSSGLGAAAVSGQPVTIVIGDLAFQHDLGGLAAVRRHGLRATIVLINNDGGGIFSFLPQAGLPVDRFEELFGTPQGIDFGAAAKAFGVAHRRVRGWADFRASVAQALVAPAASIIEVATDRRRNVELHQTIWQAVGEAT